MIILPTSKGFLKKGSPIINWLIGGVNNTLIGSADGINWIDIQSPLTSSASISAIHHNGSIWIIGNTLGEMAYSSNGISWTLLTSLTYSINSINYARNLWVACGNSGRLWSSNDGISWSRITTSGIATNTNYTVIKYAQISSTNYAWFMGGGIAACSLNLNTWINWNRAGGSIWGFYTTMIWLSSVGGGPLTKHWVVNSAYSANSTIYPANFQWNSSGLTANDGDSNGTNMHIYVGNSGSIRKATTSTINNASYFTVTSGVTNNLIKVRYGRSMWIICGNNGIILKSTNGDNWTSQTYGTSNLISIGFKI